MTNNTEKKSAEQTTTEEPLAVLFERYNATISEVTISPEAKAALEFITKFGAKAEDLPIPDGVKAELIKVSKCQQNKEEVLKAVHQRYEALTEKRNAITEQMDSIQAFLKRTTGKTSGRVRSAARKPIQGSGATVVGRWLVSPAEALKDCIEYDHTKSPSTGFKKGSCPYCPVVIESNYNSWKQHVARHEEAIRDGLVTWE